MSKKKVIEDMIALDVYKKEFDAVIAIYVELVKQYKVLSKEFKDSDYQVEEEVGYADNMKKKPIVATLENLRKDILRYANELGLTPLGLKKLKERNQQKQTPNFLNSLLNE